MSSIFALLVDSCVVQPKSQLQYSFGFQGGFIQTLPHLIPLALISIQI